MPRPAFHIFAQHYLAALLSDFGKVYLNTPIPRDPKLRVYKFPSRLNWSNEVLTKMTAGNDRIKISPEVTGEAELVDILFEPDPTRSRTSLGLLGELLFVPCIIAPLRSIPTMTELRTCLQYWLRWQVEADGSILPADDNSVYIDIEEEDDQEQDYELKIERTLLIILPSLAQPLPRSTESKQLMAWGARPSSRNISGVYDFPPAFGTTIVVTSELPQDDSTLWLRLLGRGPTQRSAIQELINLDCDRPLRSVARSHLQQWYRLLAAGQMGTESKHLMVLLDSIES